MSIWQTIKEMFFGKASVRDQFETILQEEKKVVQEEIAHVKEVIKEELPVIEEKVKEEIVAVVEKIKKPRKKKAK
jgi:gas vesicle protein